MKPRLMEALENMRRHNAGVMSRECFGFEPDVCRVRDWEQRFQ